MEIDLYLFIQDFGEQLWIIKCVLMRYLTIIEWELSRIKKTFHTCWFNSLKGDESSKLMLVDYRRVDKRFGGQAQTKVTVQLSLTLHLINNLGTSNERFQTYTLANYMITSGHLISKVNPSTLTPKTWLKRRSSPFSGCAVCLHFEDALYSWNILLN